MLKTISEISREFPTAWPSDQSLYRAIREGVIPAGVAVKIGRRLLINRERLVQWIEGGGQGLAGGWRREGSN
jgi:hypothetical protein